MLLQMIQPSQPVDFSMNAVAHLRRRSLNYMQHTFVFSVDAIDYSSIAKHARVTRLSTAGWIERGPIQGDGDLTVIELAQTDDARVEFQQTGILVIQPFSGTHDSILVSYGAKFKKQSTDFADYTDGKEDSNRIHGQTGWMPVVA